MVTTNLSFLITFHCVGSFFDCIKWLHSFKPSFVPVARFYLCQVHYIIELVCRCFSFIKSVQLFVTLWTVVCLAPLSMEFSREEYWSGLPFPSPGDLRDPRVKAMSPALAHRFFTNDPHRKPRHRSTCGKKRLFPCV